MADITSGDSDASARSTSQPLGLPEGTVRAIFALMFAATACYLAIAQRVPSDVFLPVVMAIVGYYFGVRQGNGAQAEGSRS
jgi:hypothetical protein